MWFFGVDECCYYFFGQVIGVEGDFGGRVELFGIEFLGDGGNFFYYEGVILKYLGGVVLVFVVVQVLWCYEVLCCVVVVLFFGIWYCFFYWYVQFGDVCQGFFYEGLFVVELCYVGGEGEVGGGQFGVVYLVWVVVQYFVYCVLVYVFVLVYVGGYVFVGQGVVYQYYVVFVVGEVQFFGDEFFNFQCEGCV